MRPEEARWIGQAIAELDLADRTVVNVGSSTGRFRERTQPHIEREIFAPLRARGARVIHCDMKAAEGVDLVGDLLDPEFNRTVAALEPALVLANNLFEHVRDRAVLAASLAALPAPGGRLLISVPYAYPYHADPIDTLYRPTPDEIAELFPDYAPERTAIVGSTSLWDDLTAAIGTRRALLNVARRLARLLVPFVRPRAWRGTLSGLVWLTRPRSVSIASLVRRPPATATEAPGQ